MNCKNCKDSLNLRNSCIPKRGYITQILASIFLP
jgi:hypothetical protein